MRSLVSETAVETADFQAQSNETVTFRRAQLQIPASWSAETVDETLYLTPGGDAAEEAVAVRAVPLEVPEDGLADADVQAAAAEAFFSAYRRDYVDFAVIQQEYTAAGEGCPELFLCAFKGVRDGVSESRSAGFFCAGGELYVLEISRSENDPADRTGDAYRILCCVTDAPEAEWELSQDSSLEPTPTPSPEPVPTPEPTSSPTPTPETTVPVTPAVSEPASEDVTCDYVLNTNSKKFHFPSCSSVTQMKQSNKKLYTGTRDELIAQGYSPCGKCHP